MTSASSSNLGPLNPGNVVSGAIRLYRDRFKMYLTLSATAYLWLIVPIYGWAKYGMYTGLMSRLAFQELMNQPETPKEAYRQVSPKTWAFLGLSVLLFLIFVAAYLAISLVGVLAGVAIGGLASYVLTAIFGQGGGTFAIIVTALVAIAAVLLGLLWIVGRLIVAEVPMAVEPRVDPSTSIGRSWQLSKKSIVRIQFVVMAAYLVTLPVLIFLSILPQVAVAFVEPGSSLSVALSSLVFLLSFASGILTLPFWQVVKGVLYYDLRSRREGLDLKLVTDTVTDPAPDTLSDEPL
ncbi:MAG: hypothetical protein DCF25_03380 [Leptolyngbya foveolarum]|uniref:DUF975 domain-containing protein n=1 Tax=Leptolyngbya foveolarum TaxID=47253 RepID=A0A2W4USG8_9CYAN|nr:MAG: hypothetical protein DCF25_03380 [Leptolyngbya foveolarum]